MLLLRRQRRPGEAWPAWLIWELCMQKGVGQEANTLLVYAGSSAARFRHNAAVAAPHAIFRAGWARLQGHRMSQQRPGQPAGLPWHFSPWSVCMHRYSWQRRAHSQLLTARLLQYAATWWAHIAFLFFSLLSVPHVPFALRQTSNTKQLELAEPVGSACRLPCRAWRCCSGLHNQPTHALLSLIPGWMCVDPKRPGLQRRCPISAPAPSGVWRQGARISTSHASPMRPNGHLHPTKEGRLVVVRLGDVLSTRVLRPRSAMQRTAKLQETGATSPSSACCPC